LIIWDEAPMINKYAFEAVNRCLQDIMREVDPRNADLLFGGKIVVFGGDFRQILPVVPKVLGLILFVLRSILLFCGVVVKF
jgi:hypothetical protein